jgi:adenosine deaminase
MKKRKFGEFYLDLEKDMIVELYMEDGVISYVLRTPNHHTGNLISNLAKLCDLPLSIGEDGLKVIKGIVPAYLDQYNKRVYIFRLGDTKVANIYDDGRIEMKASIPAVSKTLMAQTKNYQLDIRKTVIKSYILEDCKFRSDLHVHMNGILSPDVLIALGIAHQIAYPYYYVRKLELGLTEKQLNKLESRRRKAAKESADCGLNGRYLERRIDDNTFINFADLILNDSRDRKENIARIRKSLAILKDGQAVFTNLEKVYLYRYVFTKARLSEDTIELRDIGRIPDPDIRRILEKILEDRKDPRYARNTLFQDKLLWIARTYRSMGIEYVEISDTTLVKPGQSVEMLRQVHEVMPAICEETGVTIRFLAAIRRIPLTIVRDQKISEDYLSENVAVLSSVIVDPYVTGVDIVGEEINDIRELKQTIGNITKIAGNHEGFVFRIHAGENDSLTDNVYNSIRLVKESLSPGQKMPRMRIGHGLYTADLRSRKGRELLKIIKENGVTLEFQISSNVRLNNLNSLDVHPIKKYLNKGIDCVVGTDGMALYGTSCIDEQLALERLLELGVEDMKKIRQTEDRLIRQGLADQKKKMKEFAEMSRERDLAEILTPSFQRTNEERNELESILKDSMSVFKDVIRELPWDAFPIIIAGGSFNSMNRKTRVRAKAASVIDALMEQLDPAEVFFIIGDSLSGYESYLMRRNRKGFPIYAVVPPYVEDQKAERIIRNKLFVRVSTERSMGLYKSFNYEIFERRPSILIAFDGNSAASNLIQEARNGKGKAKIWVWHDSPLLAKAEQLEGYVQVFDDERIVSEVSNVIRNAKDIPLKQKKKR